MIASGNAEEVLANPRVREVYLGRTSDVSHVNRCSKPSLQLRLGQQLTMTPQLQQAIRLLQLPALELQAHIRELLETNVMLEARTRSPRPGGPKTNRSRQRRWAAKRPAIPSPTAASRSSRTPGPDQSAGAGGEPLEPGRRRAPAGIRRRRRRNRCTSTCCGSSSWRRSTTRELAIARAIIDAINDDGYLADSLDDHRGHAASRRSTPTRRRSRQVLAIVQSLDPPGVGARTVSECLPLQLRAARRRRRRDWPRRCMSPRSTSTCWRGATLTVLRRELEGSRGRSASWRWRWCAAAIRGPAHDREPRRGRVRRARRVRPAHAARRLERGDQPVHAAASVRVNQGYASLLGRGAGHANMRTQLQEARWLLKSLEIRNETLTQGGALDRRAPDRRSSSRARSTCGR